MQAVPQSVLDAFAASGRSIRTQVDVYFGLTPTVYTGADYIQHISLLTQESAADNSPYGVISANECTISLNNLDRRFTVSNSASPLYGQLTKGIKVVVKFIIDTPTPYTLTLGTFYTVDWRLGNPPLTVDLICRDRLMSIKPIELSNSRVFTNITVQAALVQIFTLAGLSASDYDIESGLNYVIPYFYIANSTVGAELQKFIRGYGCRIYVSDDDKILVRRVRTTSKVLDMTGSNYIVGIAALPSGAKSYSKVQLSYNIPEVRAGELVYQGDLVAGAQTLAFRENGVLLIESLLSGTEITSLSYGNSSADVNSSAGGTVDIIGTQVAWKETIGTGSNAGLVTAIGEVPMNLASTIVQSAAEATNFINHTLALVHTPKEPFITLECRGNLALQLGDKLGITDAHGLFTGQYHIVEMYYKYTGGLRATYKCLAAEVI